MVVMGANRGKSIRNSMVLTSFLVGVPYKGTIVPICNVGTGFNEQTAKKLQELI